MIKPKSIKIHGMILSCCMVIMCIGPSVVKDTAAGEVQQLVTMVKAVSRVSVRQCTPTYNNYDIPYFHTTPRSNCCNFNVLGNMLSECQEDRDIKNKRIGPELLVMSFNIRNGRADDGENRWEKRRDILFNIFHNHKPDVVGLQEAVSFQVDEICKALPEYGVVKGSKEGKTNGQYVAILFRIARFRVEEYATFWFSRTPDLAGSKHPGNNWARTCTWAKLTDKKTGCAFFVYNLHLGGSQSALEENIQLLGRRIRDRKPSYAVMVIGDFNADEGNPAILYLKGKIPLKTEDHGPDTNPVPLIDTFRVLHPDVKAGTYGGFGDKNDGKKIDYVFVLPGTEVIKAQILHDNRDGRYPSDHFPVAARIRLHSNKQ